MAQKNDHFSHFAKHRFIKKNTFVGNPPLDQKLVFLNLCFLKPNALMLNKNITQNLEKKQRYEKGISKRKRDRKPKKEKMMKETFVVECFDVVLFMKQSKEERKGKKETKTRKQKKN